MRQRKQIAVIGAGISGIVCAELLSRQHDLTLYEKNSYVGGHTNTIQITDGPDAGLAVDTGFIVLNDRTYPNFHAFLRHLEVPWRYTDMSFSVWCKKKNLMYGSSGLKALFAQKRNFFSPTFWKFLSEIRRFWRVASEALESGKLASKTMGQFLFEGHFSNSFRDDFLYPLGGAIWSTPTKVVSDFPAVTFLTFFRNHGYLNYFGQPRWQTVVGGSHSYVKKFIANFKGDLILNSGVLGVERCLKLEEKAAQKVTFKDGSSREYDEVILACHADEARSLVKDPSAEESQALSPWSYNTNRTILHTDTSFMPEAKAAWASWNYTKEEDETGQEAVCITYDMNRLQGLETSERYFVTLNPRREPKSILKEFNYTHPIYLPSSVAAQERLQSINGQNGRWYAGAYLGFGFHEDGVVSALKVTKHFGETL